jgi:hypothetical protein
MTSEVARGHVRVGVNSALSLKPGALHRPSLIDPSADCGTALVSRLGDEIAIGNGGDLEVNVDTVE